MSEGVTVLLILGGVLTLLGAVFGVVALIRLRMTSEWTSTTGVVVDRRTGRADGGMPAIYPTFQWQDDGGRLHQRTSMMRASLGPRPGTRVPVRFDPREPSRAMIDTTVQSGRILIPIAGALLVLGLLLLGLSGASALSG